MVNINDIINMPKENVPTKMNNQFDKNMFLQILVAQMKYQNPLEPASDTEYMSQYAMFSQVEQLNNISNAVNALRADFLVGKKVRVGDETDIIDDVEGVVHNGNNVYLKIQDKEYSLDDIKEIIDTDYVEE